MEVGDKMIEFSLKDHNGQLLTISPNDGKKRVIYFYPKNNTRKCTEQACSFRDWQDDFLDNGYEVIGISLDSPNSHLKFKAKHHLNFTLLSDTKGKVRRMFGATILGLFPARKTFLIDENGIIQFVYDTLLEGKEHVEEMLVFLAAEKKKHD